MWLSSPVRSIPRSLGVAIGSVELDLRKWAGARLSVGGVADPKGEWL